MNSCLTAIDIFVKARDRVIKTIDNKFKAIDSDVITIDKSAITIDNSLNANDNFVKKTDRNSKAIDNIVKANDNYSKTIDNQTPVTAIFRHKKGNKLAATATSNTKIANCKTKKDNTIAFISYSRQKTGFSTQTTANSSLFNHNKIQVFSSYLCQL